MERWQGRVALVTGASTGIGAGLVKWLSGHGVKVVGCARRPEKIEDMAKTNPLVFPYKCDVTDFDGLEKMFQWIDNHQELGRVDICLANAGLLDASALLEASPETFLKCLNVNVVGVQHCFKLATNLMIKKGVNEGHLMVTGSVAGEKIHPLAKLYSVSKVALVALVECWRTEMRAKGLNIRVSCISPGPVDTGIFKTDTSSEKVREITQEGENQIGLLDVEEVISCFELALALPPAAEIQKLIVKHIKSP